MRNRPRGRFDEPERMLKLHGQTADGLRLTAYGSDEDAIRAVRQT